MRLPIADIEGPLNRRCGPANHRAPQSGLCVRCAHDRVPFSEKARFALSESRLRVTVAPRFIFRVLKPF